MKKKICIIGAGPGGLCAIKNAIENPNLEATVFERAEKIGGIWRYSNSSANAKSAGRPKFPTPIHKNLQMNTPKLAHFLDYPFSEDVEMFPKLEAAMEYLQSYADAHNLSDHIKFHQEVIEVKPINPKNRENPGWAVKVKCLETDVINLCTFDYVIVCTGHEMEHSVPEIPGIENFKGSVLTAAEYFDREDYTGKRVLLLGAGVSGYDIALDLLEAQSKEVIISQRPRCKILAGIVTTFPEGIRVVAKLKSVDGAGALILDDDSVLNGPIDAIIFTTGYNYNYKFLAAESGIFVENQRRINYLYYHIVNVKFPTMFFLGVTYYSPAFYMLSVQSKWVAKIIDGTVTLPNEAQMMSSVQQMRDDIKSLELDEFNFAHNIFIPGWKHFEKFGKEGQFDIFPYMEPVFSNIVLRLLMFPDKFRYDIYTKIDDQIVEICNCS